MNGNHIFPFLWMRGEPETVIRREMEKIHQANIGAVCVEARPHPDFGGEQWWHDMDIVLDEAKKRDMKVWILDDAHFPTGQANGIIPSKYPERARRYVFTQHVDVTGPIPFGALDVELMTTRKTTWMDLAAPKERPILDEHALLSVVAVRVIQGDVISQERISLDGNVKNGQLLWDVPGGTWRIFVTFLTTDFGACNGYINYIDRQSAAAQLEAVYEPHYARYASEFGKTIAGFFSDEPGFYNVSGFKMDEAIGRKLMPLPWCDEMTGLMEAALGAEWKQELPYLWYDCETSKVSASIRYCYMDAVTKLYAKNFSGQIGDWCRAHGVAYIGHVIEDNNQHTRLGSGAGHFFRALSGQDMAGIDNIGNQIIPGRPDANRHTPAYVGNGEFFHYGLVRLGASAAQIDPKKQGRLMCENFGAYGWSLGVKHMKWLADYMMAQGVNHFVPHAFSMAKYPDDDCPPHFYAQGNNPQYPFFGELMKYINKVCGWLSGGVNVPQAAILYEAEADWMGDAMNSHIPARVLTEHQIEFEILPADVFAEPEIYGTKVENGTLIVNHRKMKALVVPASEALSPAAAAFLAENPTLPVLFIDRKPAFVPNREELSFLSGHRVVTLAQLPDALRALGCADMLLGEPCRNLIVYHYRREKDLYFVMNTSLDQRVDVDVTLNGSGRIGSLDLWDDRWSPIGEAGLPFRLTLLPYQSRLLVVNPDAIPEVKRTAQREIDLSSDWSLSLRECGTDGMKADHIHMQSLKPVSLDYPSFSGEMIYRKTFTLEEQPIGGTLSVQYLFEAADVYVNGAKTACRICPPYDFDLGDRLCAGENVIEVHAVNTAVRNANKTPGVFGIEREILEPSGMFGSITPRF